MFSEIVLTVRFRDIGNLSLGLKEKFPVSLNSAVIFFSAKNIFDDQSKNVSLSPLFRAGPVRHRMVRDVNFFASKTKLKKKKIGPALLSIRD